MSPGPLPEFRTASDKRPGPGNETSYLFSSENTPVTELFDNGTVLGQNIFLCVGILCMHMCILFCIHEQSDFV